jgi:ribonuclease HI
MTKRIDIVAFTDGSSFVDNKGDRHGGIGVYFQHDNKLNISKSYTTGDVTNQRMELLACIKCIEKCVRLYKTQLWDLHIYTDSMYSMNCASVWASDWIKLGWKRYVGGKLKDNICNLDLIKKLYKLTKLYNVNYTHVRSHQKKPEESSDKYFLWVGNDQADKLANKAMKSSKTI